MRLIDGCMVKMERMRRIMIKAVWREERFSKKSESTYQVLVIEFGNGYKLKTFLNNEQQYILKDIPLKK